MLFFKYYSPVPIAFSLIRNGEMFFAQADELNDSNELRPTFILKGDKELWGRLFDYILIHSAFLLDKGYTRSKTRSQLVYAVSGNLSAQFYKRYWRQDIRLEELYSLVKDDVLASDFGDMSPKVIAANFEQFMRREVSELVRPREFIASFSNSGINTMMWGHYAKAGKGFAIVYESSDSTLKITSDLKIYDGSRDKNGILLPGQKADGIITIGTWADATLELKKVHYAPRDVKVNAFHLFTPHFFYSEEEDHYDVPLLIGAGAPKKGEDRVGLIKDEVWGFEDEIRAFLPLYSDKNEYIPPSKRVAMVDLSHFRGLILGPEISEKDRIELIVALKSLLFSRRARGDSRAEEHNLVVFQAVRGRDSFSYKVHPSYVINGTRKLTELSALHESESRRQSPEAWMLADQVNQKRRRLGR
ncbi:MAG: hypothetical protein RI969_64 [Verrucomicrobiota bacterium]|jgi:hypothetical protein